MDPLPTGPAVQITGQLLPVQANLTAFFFCICGDINLHDGSVVLTDPLEVPKVDWTTFCFSIEIFIDLSVPGPVLVECKLNSGDCDRALLVPNVGFPSSCPFVQGPYRASCGRTQPLDVRFSLTIFDWRKLILSEKVSEYRMTLDNEVHLYCSSFTASEFM